MGIIRKIASLLGLWKSTEQSRSERFPYQYKEIDFGKVPDPLIKLEIKTKFDFLTFKFLVDSGADVTSLPFNPFAMLLGYKKDESQKVTIGGIGGKGVAGYPTVIQVRMLGKLISLSCFLIESKAMPILGRFGVWDKYSICFDNKTQEIVFTQI